MRHGEPSTPGRGQGMMNARRRLLLLGGPSLVGLSVPAGAEVSVEVWRDLYCGCCGGWCAICARRVPLGANDRGTPTGREFTLEGRGHST